MPEAREEAATSVAPERIEVMADDLGEEEEQSLGWVNSYQASDLAVTQPRANAALGFGGAYPNPTIKQEDWTPEYIARTRELGMRVGKPWMGVFFRRYAGGELWEVVYYYPDREEVDVRRRPPYKPERMSLMAYIACRQNDTADERRDREDHEARCEARAKPSKVAALPAWGPLWMSLNARRTLGDGSMVSFCARMTA